MAGISCSVKMFVHKAHSYDHTTLVSSTSTTTVAILRLALNLVLYLVRNTMTVSVRDSCNNGDCMCIRMER